MMQSKRSLQTLNDSIRLTAHREGKGMREMLITHGGSAMENQLSEIPHCQATDTECCMMSSAGTISLLAPLR